MVLVDIQETGLSIACAVCNNATDCIPGNVHGIIEIPRLGLQYTVHVAYAQHVLIDFSLAHYFSSD